MVNRMLLSLVACLACGSNVQASTQLALYDDRTIVVVGAYADMGYIRFSAAVYRVDVIP